MRAAGLPVLMFRALLLALLAGQSRSSLIAQSADPYLTQQFSARNLVIRFEDFTLTLADGAALKRDVRGLTTLVLLGKGTMRFAPPIESERSQVRWLGGADVLESSFDVAVVRAVHPEKHANLGGLVPQKVEPGLLRRSEQAFPDLRFGPLDSDLRIHDFDVADVSADVRTSRFGALRYTCFETAPEAISLVQFGSRKTIAVYPSSAQVAARDRSYREDAQQGYDVLHHDVALTYEPDRRFIEGTAAMRVRITAERLSSVSFRLAEGLVTRSISIQGSGVVAWRPSPQGPIEITLPSAVPRGAELTIVVSYRGAVVPPAAEWEMPQPAGAPALARPERAQLTSTFPMWYPRPPFIDYATATLRISVPSGFDCVATGELAEGSPEVDGTVAPSRRIFRFAARQPVRHLAFLVAPFALVDRVQLTVEDGPASGIPVTLTTMAQPSVRSGAPAIASAAADMVQFYRSLLGDMPYPDLTVALVGGQLPGGHSAGYFSAVGQPPRGTAPFWRDDPAAYDTFPNFLLAHEIAHQWWGQAVGWNTYHDQWMSEAFAQYFALLHAGHQDGPAATASVLRRMRTWAIRESRKGPLSLGPRLGVVQGDDSVFRALLYNKGPAVLHMLRRLIGDDAFFAGVRRFYTNGRFGKPSTADLQAAMEAAAGYSLERFFRRWVDGSALPQLKFSYRVDAGGQGTNGDATLRIEQTGELFDVPVTVILQYADRPPAGHVVHVSDRVTELRVPLAGRLRRAEVSKDDGTVAEVR